MLLLPPPWLFIRNHLNQNNFFPFFCLKLDFFRQFFLRLIFIFFLDFFLFKLYQLLSPILHSKILLISNFGFFCYLRNHYRKLRVHLPEIYFLSLTTIINYGLFFPCPSIINFWQEIHYYRDSPIFPDPRFEISYFCI